MGDYNFNVAGSIKSAAVTTAQKMASFWSGVKKVSFGVAATSGTVALYGAIAPEPALSKATSVAAGTVFLISGVIGGGAWLLQKIDEGIVKEAQGQGIGPEGEQQENTGSSEKVDQ